MTASAGFAAAHAEVAYAFDNTVFFRKHMEANGLRPGDITSEADFRRIPPTSKSHYRRNFPAGVLANGFTLQSPHVMRFQSSGTGGDRLNSVILAYDLARRQATALSVNRRFDDLRRPGERPRSCRYAPPNCSDVECATGASTVEARSLPDGTLVLTVAHDLLATPEWQITQALDEIELTQPDILVVDPTHFAFLVRWARRLGREITSTRKLHVICGYTLLTRVARRQISGFMGPDVPIGDMIGMSELGYLGFECHEGNRHVNDRDFYLEFVAADGAPVECGQTGEMYVTTVEDELVPRIRYATGDLFTPLDGCACGSELPAVRVEGRAAHTVRLTDGRTLTPGALDAVVGAEPGIVLYKLEQDRGGSCVFRYIASEGAHESDLAELRDRVSGALAPITVRFKQVDYIPSERSGKFQSCVSEQSRNNT